MIETDYTETNNDANRRVLIQIYYERINHLANLISNLNGFIIAILVGIIVGIFAIHDFYGITILTIIGIISLIGWRIHVRSIDKEIQEFYNLVINCEEKLTIEDNFRLSKRGRFGDRGHRVNDIIAFFSGVVLLLIF